MTTHIGLGRRGEEAAAAYLSRLGWTILDRNWRSRDGELDIVAHDGREHIVCEVKTRSSARFGDPLDAITPAKAARLRRLAWQWAAARGVGGTSVRVDVLGLVADGDGFSVDHLREVC
ncbi:YraN family protein [Actinomadura roseirufa]|uniref:YraN family protein n=1 Tax=Actinomadura roseirufa TaxID=2094049 RepID=UPI00104155FB|nr:YraN family protein [Actinomadura roseirufa]